MTLQWSKIDQTAVSGSVVPGPRRSASGFVTLGKLWLYGGISTSAQELDDMYYYDLTRAAWVLITAPSTGVDSPVRTPVYGPVVCAMLFPLDNLHSCPHSALTHLRSHIHITRMYTYA